MTQERKIIAFIRDHGSITTMQAFGIGITRLASRVHDLRCHGVNVEKTMIPVRNAEGETCHVAQYTIPGGVPECFA